MQQNRSTLSSPEDRTAATVSHLTAQEHLDITDILPHIVWMTHPDGRTLYLNRRWTEYTGYTFEETLERGWNWFLHPDDIPAAEAEGKQAEHAGERYEVEFRIRGVEGTYRWFLSRGVPVKDEQGHLARWIGTCTDIDEQKQNEQAQRLLAALSQRTRLQGEPEEVLRQAVHLVGEYLQVSRCNYATLDPKEGTITFQSGYGTEGPSHEGTYPLASFGDEIVGALARGRTVVVEDTQRDPRTAAWYPGSYAPFGIRGFIATPILKNSVWVALLGVHTVEPRRWKQDEAQLLEAVAEQTWLARENAQLYQKTRAAVQRTEEAYAVLNTLLKTAPVGFALFDTELRYVRVNDALAEMSGIRAADHLGKTVDEVLPEMSPQMARYLRQVLETGEPIMEQEVIGETPAAPGQLRYWLTSFYPVLDPSGSLLGIGSILADITDRKRSEAHIEALYARLQRAVKETHHRVKNNLQLMAAMVDMRLMEEVQTFTPEELRQLGIHIRTLALVHDILTQKPREDEQSLSLSIKELLERLVSLLAQTTANRRIQAQVEDALLSSKQGTSLALLLNELISNALKHGNSDVSVFFTVRGEQGELLVQDDGPGFPAGFDPQQSSSIGLELVLNLSSLDLGGTAEFQNRPEGGAQVLITFPLNNSATAMVP